MIERKIDSYYEELLRMYPTIDMGDIKKICLYGFKSLYLANSYGADVHLSDGKNIFHFGNLYNDSLRFYELYKRKLATKIRVLYKRRKKKWDGYYYFALTKRLYHKYLELIKKRGRPRKHFIFEKVILYQIEDECQLINSNKTAFFRYNPISYLGYSKYYPILKTDNAELLYVLEPKKMSEILVSNYDYEFLTDSRYKKCEIKRKNGRNKSKVC